MALTLYEIDRAIETALEIALAEQVDPETGEIISGDFEQLEQLAAARDEKFESIGAYIKNLSAEVAALKAEEDTLKQRRQAKEKQIERLKGYVANSMTNAGQNKFESRKVVFSFRSSKSVNVTNLEAVPKEFIKIKTEVSADKTAIGKLLKAGQAVAGCELLENKSLQIK